MVRLLHRLVVRHDGGVDEVVRKTVSLYPWEWRRVAPFLDPERPEYPVLREWAAERELVVGGTTAGVIRALIRAGEEAMRERVSEEGYRLMAEAQAADPEYQAEQAMRERARRHRTCACDGGCGAPVEGKDDEG